jgi:hypothetical protein
MATVNLAPFEGLNIDRICGNEFTDPGQNHCAHLVCHWLNLGFGYTCRSAGRPNADGANLRVHELFARCPRVGRWADKPAGTVLAFVTAAANVQLKAPHQMVNVPNKHVGIFVDPYIWNYDNTGDKVWKETVPVFEQRFRTKYGSTATLFFGTFPAGANTVTVGATS